jgi:signal transduction histidine kinase
VAEKYRNLWLSDSVSSPAARLAVLPRATASAILTSAVSRTAWAIAILILVLDIPLVLDVLAGRGLIVAAVLPITMLVGMIALLIVTGITASTTSRIVMLVGGAFFAAVYQISLLSADPDLNMVATYVLNRPAFILVLVGPGISRPLLGLMWSGIGYIVATATLVVSSTIAGVPIIPGWGPSISFGIYGSAFIALTLIRSTQAAQLPDLMKLELETRKLALEHQFELRAAAVVHDTVLNDLSVVMNSTGTLDARTRERLASDVETLSHGSWLRESRELVTFDASDEALRNGMVTIVSEMQWKGLTVDVTGNPPNVVRLSRDRISAVHAAVKACLENVLRHAHTPTAELVLGAGDGRLTVMIVDHGIGFDPTSIAADRLGIRASVIDRVESLGGSVKVWSTVGDGTSVIISMPAEVIDDPVA